MKKSMRKGFTLVELLIVIVVIGILSAMMMLSSTEAVSSARAADIVSDLRNLKTAALAYYADNLDAVEKSTWAGLDDSTVRGEVFKYMGNGTDKDEYTFGGEYNTKWFVWCHVKDAKVIDKLVSRKASVGLWKAKGDTAANATESDDLVAASDTYVGMFIR